jgi:uncharacterized protein (TIGR00251 family)
VADREFRLHDGKKGAALAIRVTPRAAKNEIHEIQNDGTVKIHLTASSIESKMNQALIEFLSQVLEIPTGKIEIVVGASSRDKLVSVLDLDADMVHQRILKHIA